MKIKNNPEVLSKLVGAIFSSVAILTVYFAISSIFHAANNAFQIMTFFSVVKGIFEIMAALATLFIAPLYGYVGYYLIIPNNGRRSKPKED